MVVTVWTSFSVFWVFFSADFMALNDLGTDKDATLGISADIFILTVLDDHSYLIGGFNGFEFFPFSRAFVVIVPKKVDKQVRRGHLTTVTCDKTINYVFGNLLFGVGIS